jgi:hypothetical protein
MDVSPALRSLLRPVVLVLAATEILILSVHIGFLLSVTDPTDALGSSIAHGVALLASIPLLVCALPAMLLGVVNRWLPLALLLACAAVPVAWFLWASA